MKTVSTGEAAKQLGIEKKTLQRKLWEHNTKGSTAEDPPVRPCEYEETKGMQAWRWTEDGIARLKAFLEKHPVLVRGRKPGPQPKRKKKP